MFGKQMVRSMIERSAENDTDRRNFLRSAGVAGLGVVGATALSSAGASSALAARGPSDGAILNFALNLEYLEAEFYSHAAFGHGLAHQFTTGKGRHGGVTGGRAVNWQTPAIRKYATEIAHDEVSHVKFLRSALGSARVARPEINLKYSFTAAARAAGRIGPRHQSFDPYANENNFLLAAFLFEDVGVTAYKGAAPLIDNKTYLEAAAGILAVEAYHAGIVRTNLYAKGLNQAVRDYLRRTGQPRRQVQRRPGHRRTQAREPGPHRRQRHRLQPHPPALSLYRLPQPEQGQPRRFLTPMASTAPSTPAATNPGRRSTIKRPRREPSRAAAWPLPSASVGRQGNLPRREAPGTSAKPRPRPDRQRGLWTVPLPLQETHNRGEPDRATWRWRWGSSEPSPGACVDRPGEGTLPEGSGETCRMRPFPKSRPD